MDGLGGGSEERFLGPFVLRFLYLFLFTYTLQESDIPPRMLRSKLEKSLFVFVSFFGCLLNHRSSYVKLCLRKQRFLITVLSPDICRGDSLEVTSRSKRPIWSFLSLLSLSSAASHQLRFSVRWHLLSSSTIHPIGTSSCLPDMMALSHWS